MAIIFYGRHGYTVSWYVVQKIVCFKVMIRKEVTVGRSKESVGVILGL